MFDGFGAISAVFIAWMLAKTQITGDSVVELLVVFGVAVWLIQVM